MTAINLNQVSPSRQKFGLRALHILALCAFAFTQPILIALIQRAVYIYDGNYDWFEISALIGVLSLLLPLSFVGIDWAVGRLASRVKGRGRNFIPFLLFTLIILTLTRPYTSYELWNKTGLAGIFACLLALFGAAVAVRLYEKSHWARLWLTFASAGCVLFPMTFLFQFHSLRKTAVDQHRAAQVKNPVPVVMVVFDEFSSTTLLNDRMEIDAERFPNFARLAGMSTFYRNMTTVHPRTDVAVPTILSGRFPVADLPALETYYPGNLFQTIEWTKIYEMAVFEPVSRLCPNLEAVYRPDSDRVTKAMVLLHTLAAVYPRLVFAKDFPVDLPAIPRDWFGFRSHFPSDVEDWSGYTEGSFHYSGSLNRVGQLKHFLTCIKASEKPRFTFLHAELPHPAWAFFPSGEQYFVESNYSSNPAGAVGELNEDWLNDPPTVLRNQFRYRLQLGFVDRFIGQLLDRLTETGVLDQCLLVVTADHGVSFRPGHSRRLPDADNLADIMSVPLFIKRPGESIARIDDRNVESIDILPTIAEELGIELREPVDGTPVSQEKRRPRKTLYHGGNMTIAEPDLPQRKAAVLRQFQQFGDRALERMPDGVSSNPEWHGRPISDFVVESRSIPAIKIDTLTPHRDSDNLKIVQTSPNFIRGYIHASDWPEKSARIVVAVDDVVCDTGMTYWRSAKDLGIEFLLPQTIVLRDDASVKLYLAKPTEKLAQLIPVDFSEIAPDESKF